MITNNMLQTKKIKFFEGSIKEAKYIIIPAVAILTKVILLNIP